MQVSNANRLGLPEATPWCDPEWTLGPAVTPTPLIGANGIRRGPDGRLYVAQAFGSQVSAVDVETGEVEIISPVDGEFIAPDDVAFDSRGNLYVTDIMKNQVGAIRPNGQVDVIASDLPVANGLTIVNDRVFISEYRPGGRIFELYADGGSPRLLAGDLDHPNAFAMGPDGFFYFPAVGAGEIWRLPMEGGAPTRFTGGLNFPTAVKFDRRGRLFTTCAGDGSVAMFDLSSGRKEIFATAPMGIDNLDLGDDGSVFISHFTDGTISRLRPGAAAETIVPGAMLGPFGIACGTAGEILVADGVTLAILGEGGVSARPVLVMDEGAPPFMRGVAVAPDGTMYFTSPMGTLARYRFGSSAELLAEGLQQPMGVAISPDGQVLVCEEGAGKVRGFGNGSSGHVLASGLQGPSGICAGPGGAIFVSEASAGRVLAIDGSGGTAVLAADLVEPQGLAVHRDRLYVLDKGAGAVVQVELASGTAKTIAAGFATDAPLAGRRNILTGIPELMMNGPLTPFAGLAVGRDGTIYASCEAEGSVWQICPAKG